MPSAARSSRETAVVSIAVTTTGTVLPTANVAPATGEVIVTVGPVMPPGMGISPPVAVHATAISETRASGTRVRRRNGGPPTGRSARQHYQAPWRARAAVT